MLGKELRQNFKPPSFHGAMLGTLRDFGRQKCFQSCRPFFLGGFKRFSVYMVGVSKNRGGPPKWMGKIMEKPIKKDDLGVPLLWIFGQFRIMHQLFFFPWRFGSVSIYSRHTSSFQLRWITSPLTVGKKLRSFPALQASGRPWNEDSESDNTPQRDDREERRVVGAFWTRDARFWTPNGWD